MIDQIPVMSSEFMTQLLIGAATILIAGITYLNSRRAAQLAIYQSYLAAWHDLNRIRIEQPALRSLIAAGKWPEDRSDQILLEAFTVKYLDILSLSYRASKFGALSRSEFAADAEDVVRELGFLAPVAKRFVELASFARRVKREFNRAYARHAPGA